MSETEIEVVGDVRRMDDGTEYRAVIQRDTDAQQPEDDGAWPIIKLYVRWGRETHWAFNKAAEPYLDAYTTLHDLTSTDGEGWERYMRMFHGTTVFHTYGPNQATDYTYIAFDTAEWRERVGCPEWAVEKGDPLYEIRAWIEGDVYGVAVETRYNPDSKLESDEDWAEDSDGWVWGHYGREWAERAAGEQLDAAVAGHEPVVRYPEHEKITKHQAEIDAITDFLEGIDGRNYALAEIFPRTEWHDPHLQRVPESRHQRVIFEHFGIDYSKIEAERAQMYQSLKQAD